MVKFLGFKLKRNNMKHKNWGGKTTVDLTSSRVKRFLAFFLEPVFHSPFSFNSFGLFFLFNYIPTTIFYIIELLINLVLKF